MDGIASKFGAVVAAATSAVACASPAVCGCAAHPARPASRRVVKATSDEARRALTRGCPDAQGLGDPDCSSTRGVGALCTRRASAISGWSSSTRKLIASRFPPTGSGAGRDDGESAVTPKAWSTARVSALASTSFRRAAARTVEPESDERSVRMHDRNILDPQCGVVVVRAVHLHVGLLIRPDEPRLHRACKLTSHARAPDGRGPTETLVPGDARSSPW